MGVPGRSGITLPQWSMVSRQAFDNAPLHVAPASGSALMPFTAQCPQILPKYEYSGGEP